MQIVITYVVSALLMLAHRRYTAMFMEGTLHNVTQKQPDDETDSDDAPAQLTPAALHVKLI